MRRVCTDTSMDLQERGAQTHLWTYEKGVDDADGAANQNSVVCIQSGDCKEKDVKHMATSHDALMELTSTE